MGKDFAGRPMIPRGRRDRSVRRAGALGSSGGWLPARGGGVRRRARRTPNYRGHDARVLPMTDQSGIQMAAGQSQARRTGRVLPARRYRHPGDVIRLIAAAVVLAVAGAVAALVPSALLRPDAAEVSGTGPGTAAGQVLAGLIQVTIAGAAVVLLVAGLRRRRFRVIATVAGGFVAAAVLTAAIMYLTGQGALGTLTAGLRRHSWLLGAGFPDPA